MQSLAEMAATCTTEATIAVPTTKRKSSTAGLIAGGRSVKRRASKACHCCRSRKVRCDVVESGIPCTNCRLDMVECMVSDSKRRKKCYGDHDFLNQSPPSSTEDTEDPAMCRTLADGLTSDIPSALDGMLTASSNGSLELDAKHHVPHMLCMALLRLDGMHKMD